MLKLRAMTPADLDLCEGPRRQHLPATLRDVHHQMARLFAMGLRTGQVAERMGFSFTRVSTIKNSPAFEALIQHYRGIVNEAYRDGASEFYALLGENTHRAERQIAERLAKADEEADQEDGYKIPLKELIAISRDGADRTGFGKRQTNVNLNVDFAASLERARKRSEQVRTIEASPSLQSQGDITSQTPVPQLTRRA